MLSLDTINMGNMYQSNEIFDCQIVLPPSEYIKYISLQIKNSFSEKIVLNGIFEHS